MICDKFRQKAIDFVERQRSPKYSILLATASGAGGMSVGLMVDPSFMVYILPTAIASSIAFVLNR